MTSPSIDPSSGPEHRANSKPAPTGGRRLALAWSVTKPGPLVFKVAFASDDRTLVNQHFGASQGFVVYAFDENQAQLAELVEFPAENMDRNEDKLPARIQALAGCAAVYCLAIGASAVKQLLAAGVQPVRLDEETPIGPLLTSIRQAISAGGIAWIDRWRKQGKDVSRFERMAAENWEE
jgi:nitrogen fixation protein NifX